MKNLKILIVDDDPVTRLLLNKKLKMAEYEFETAENGVEALNILSKCGFDVVLTDLMMPGGVDGIGVLEAVKEKYTRTEVILLTAFASVENAVEAMKKGAADYLQKPINFDELFLRLDKISNLKKLARQYRPWSLWSLNYRTDSQRLKEYYQKTVLIPINVSN
jgi:DNA-binding NtrC family response regulator